MLDVTLKVSIVLPRYILQVGILRHVELEPAGAQTNTGCNLIFSVMLQQPRVPKSELINWSVATTQTETKLGLNCRRFMASSELPLKHKNALK